MNENLYHLCHKTDNDELEIISSHSTHGEALKSRNEQYGHPTWLNLQIQCLAELAIAETQQRRSQIDLKYRIRQKQKKIETIVQIRNEIGRLRIQLSEVAYRFLSDRYIELTEKIEMGQRYIENRRRDLKYAAFTIERLVKDSALVREAISSQTAANKAAIDIMEKRSLAYMNNNAN